MESAGNGWVRRQVGARGAAPPADLEPDRSAAPPLTTFIPEGAELEGTLRLRETIRIDCEFRGEIVSEARVIVGTAAGIEADIQAREVVIAGAVVGNVSASRLVVLRASARLRGDVETSCLEIEKGAVLNGRTTMVRPELALRTGTSPPRRARKERERPRRKTIPRSAPAGAGTGSRPRPPT